jgi:adhesin/invasin
VFGAAGVVNAASFNTGGSAANTAISPGSLVTIFGTALAGETRTAVAFPLPTTLGGTSVTIGGLAAPLLYTSPAQLNLQVPFGVAGSTAEVVVTTAAGPSAGVRVPVGVVQPGIFFNTATGIGAIVHNTDGMPTTQRPARAGDFLQVFGTGLGPVNPQASTGFPAPLSPLARATVETQVTIGGRPAPVVFSGLAPGFAGLYQLTVQTPEGISAGRQAVVVTAGGSQSNEVFIQVQ